MNARPAIAFALLLTFPVSTFAQTRLDLKSINVTADEPEAKPVKLPAFKLTRDFQQAPQAVPPAPAPCVESEARGRVDADKRGLNKGWFWGSLAAGSFAHLFAVGGSTAIASAAKPKPKTVPADVDRACYTTGYGSKARKENVLSALWGSLAGTGIFILWVTIAAGASD